MTVKNIWLYDVAEKMAADSYYLGFSSDTGYVVDVSATALEGEIGSRVACTVSFADNQLFVSGTRSGALVVDTASGDRLGAYAIYNSSGATNPVAIVPLPNILHTIYYDFDIDNTVNIQRLV